MSDHDALSLAFDPSESPHYKVFCLGKTSNSSVLCHLEVYSSNEGPWRRVASVPSFTLPPTVTELGNTVFCSSLVWSRLFRFLLLTTKTTRIHLMMSEP
ncbi:hypothetical protein Bca52824_006052 [Brassica carinata]|uniref:F-box protein n=1 Tax=Brassica carinata TaxID=52824 RepID=A0A8X8BI02_BRACI|nr:hypothetical protein Bca52824_006052 [Brassica carinata]